jgi:hypothetical protein
VLLCRGSLGCGPLFEQFLLKAFSAKYLPTLPATRIGDDFLLLVVDDERGSICFDKRRTLAITFPI